MKEKEENNMWQFIFFGLFTVNLKRINIKKPHPADSLESLI